MRSKFAKEDDVELDREIKKLKRQIDKLTEQYYNFYEKFSNHIDNFFRYVEKVDDRLRILEKPWRNKE